MCRSSQFVALKSNVMIICKKCFFFHLCAILLGLNGIEPKALGDIDTDVCVRFTCNFFHTDIMF